MPRTLQQAESLDDMTTYYGPYGKGRVGVISEHAHIAVELGLATQRTLGSGTLWLIPKGRGKSVPVLCSELVWDYTEDGRVDVRCGQLAREPYGACEKHTEDIAGYHAEREAEQGLVFPDMEKAYADAEAYVNATRAQAEEEAYAEKAEREQKFRDDVRAWEEARWAEQNREIAAVRPSPESAPKRSHVPVYDGIYTVETPAGHRTFKVRTQAKDDDFAPGQQIIGYLSGKDNEKDYTSFGFVDRSALGYFVRVWKRYKDNVALQRDAEILVSDPEGALAEAHCSRCHRRLTVPASIYAGLGPECAKKEGAQ